MMHRILVNVVQPGVVGFLISEFGFPIVFPNLPALRFIFPIYPASTSSVDAFHEGAQGRGLLRRPGDEMVVIGEDCPRFQTPPELPCFLKEEPVQKVQPVRRVEVVSLVHRRGGHHEGSGSSQPVRRSMRPWILVHLVSLIWTARDLSPLFRVDFSRPETREDSSPPGKAVLKHRSPEGQSHPLHSPGRI